MSKVSVIIPCYNHGKYIDEAVESVQQQTFNDFEVIIVNDGSTDRDTNNKLSSYKQPKTRVISTENQGLAMARNVGIQAADGDYILPLDADDRIAPTYLEIAVKLLDTRPHLGIVYCRAWLFGADETEWLLPDFSLKEMLLENLIFCSAVFRKEDWERVGGYDSDFIYGWEDYDFWLSLIEIGREVYRIPRILFHYRLSDNSMVRSSSRDQKLKTFKRIFNKHKRLFNDNIDIWIDELFNIRKIYREASLNIGQEAKGSEKGKWARKVDIGQCRLVFNLEGIQDGSSAHFYPANDCAIIKGLKIVLETDGKEEIAIPQLNSNADMIKENIYYFSTSQPRITIDLSGVMDLIRMCNGKRIVFDLEYLAFGNECFPHIMKIISNMKKGYHEDLGPDTFIEETNKDRFVKTDASETEKNNLKVNRRDRKQIRIIKESGLFDEAYYLEQHPNLKTQNIDPLVHYLKVGWQQGFNPNALFDTGWYMDKHPDALEMNPLLHFVKNWHDNRDPGPYFSISYYRDQCPECWTDNVNPLSHYLHFGWREGLNPNPEFDSKGYLLQYPDVAKAEINPLCHYIQYGKKEGRRYLRFFDIDFYIEDNPSIKIDPAQHYLLFGAFEGRRPNRFFDPKYYSENYIKQQTSAKESFFHYIREGSKKNYKPNELFDPKFYSSTYPEYWRKYQYPISHYQSVGIYEGHYPCREISELEIKPTISIITPVYNTDPLLLKKSIHSVLYQAYPHWELCLVDDGSDNSKAPMILREYAKLDKRIKVKFLPENGGISIASNEGISMADGEYIGFLDHDDELTSDCLYHFADAINNYNPDILYSDEDLVNDESRYLDSFFKSAFNSELLLSHNYITHFLVVKKDLIKKTGGFDNRYDGAQDFDLLLRLTEISNSIHHIKRILYHWRATEDSTSINHRKKIYADDSGRKSVQAAIKRRHTDADVTPGIYEYYYRVERNLSSKPLISLIFIIQNERKDYVKWINNVVELTRYEQLEIKCIISGSDDIEFQRKSADECLGKNIEYFYCKKNVPHELNRIAFNCNGEYLCFLKQSTTPIYNNWVEILLGYAAEKEFGVVGGLVQYPDSYREKMKYLPDVQNDTWIDYRIFFEHCSRYLNGMESPQNVMVMSANLCMVKKRLFSSINGFDDRSFQNVMYDLDICLRLREHGFENVYTPYCEAISDDNPIFKVTENEAQKEIREFQKRWKKRLIQGDPYYNINKIIHEKKMSKEKWLNWYAGL